MAGDDSGISMFTARNSQRVLPPHGLDPEVTDGPVPDRVRVERLGDELLVLDPERGVVHRIAAVDVRAIAAGHAAAYEGAMSAPALDAVVQALGAPRWDRRRVLASGAALVGAGVATVLLPSAAAAASLAIMGVAFGTGFDNEFTVQADTVNTALSGTTQAFSVNTAAYGRWEVPSGVTEIQVVIATTMGTIAARTGQDAPSPYTGQPGRGVLAAATFTVTPGFLLAVKFSGARDWSTEGAGAGGGAVGIGEPIFNGNGSGQWLLVGGAGGGAGDAGKNPNFTVGNRYRDVGSLGGNGGDAGRGGTANSGENGVNKGDVGGIGGAGASTSAAGLGGTGNGDGQVGGSPSVPGTNNNETTLGIGGQTQNTTNNGGGNGGCGYYGGGSGGGGTLEGAGGGGGGGSSFINLGRRAAGSASKFDSLSRNFDLGPSITVYW
jgi:hypothetical protein